MTPIEQKIIEIVNENPGVSSKDLVVNHLAKVLTEDEVNTFDVRIIFTLVGIGELVEVCYCLPKTYLYKSLLFPKKTEIEVVDCN